MITPLRRRHRWMAPGALVLGLTGLGAALAARPTEHIARMRPALDPNGGLRSGGPMVFAYVSTEHDYELQLWVEDGVRELRLEPRAAGDRRPIDAPDLLLYATHAAPDRLPEDALFLGPASTSEPTTLTLPEGAGPCIVLYSLAHAKIVEAVVLPASTETDPGTLDGAR